MATINFTNGKRVLIPYLLPTSMSNAKIPMGKSRIIIRVILNITKENSEKKAFKVLRDIGVNFRTEADFATRLPKLEVIPIKPEGNYRKLYKGLADSPDIEIKEAKVDRDKGRLFFFMVDRVLYVVAVRESHYETDKQKR